ncbi:transglutaminase-like domain-containing protein [Thermotomaculum hydrothermale]|nr:transglutaminase-like domain-containing protein [Thermotomaculum hydrothermale]
MEEILSVSIDKFLEENFFFDFGDPVVAEKTNSIINGCKNEREKAVKLFNFVRDEITYTMYTGFFPEKNYKASVILKRRKGFCIQKAILLVAMLRCAGIPSAIAFADIVNYKIPEDALEFLGTNYFSYHGFVVLNLNGKWIKVTPTFDKNTCLKAGYPILDFDGENDVIFPEYLENGEKFIEYKKHHGIYFEVPFQEIIESWKEIYGEERLNLWIKESEKF